MIKNLKIFMTLFLLISGVMSCGAKEKMSKNENVVDISVREGALKDGLYMAINTNKGTIIVELFYKQTPLTVANFIGLAEGKIKNSAKEGKFYDGLNFHRVIENFMIQGGDPKGNGTGGPGYQFPDEIVASLTFDIPGLLAMANAGPGTNGSQFFITHTATPWLNGKHTIFGAVVDSAIDQPIVNSIAQGDKIESTVIIAKGDDAKTFANEAVVGGVVNPTFTEKAEAKAKEEFKKKNAADMAMVEQLFPNGYKTTKRGVFYVIEQEGSGETPKKQQTVSVNYEGRLLTTGQVFDSSYARKEPIEFPAGVGYVIAGWDEAIMEMKVGEKRKVIIPASLGYGDQGAGGGLIPGGAWLVFDMELVALK